MTPGSPLGPVPATPLSMQRWRVLIEFQETKIVYLAHIPTEEQQRGYHNDKVCRGHWSVMADNHLQIFTDAATADEAKANARQLLLKYVKAK